MDRQNLTLLTDLYQLTMIQGYFKSHNDKIVIFDLFYRRQPKKQRIWKERMQENCGWDCFEGA